MQIFSQRLRCFYCGCRPNNKPSNTRRWTCQKCAAVNYLDDKGNIRDPPVKVTAQPASEARYTVPPENPESESAATDNSVFCLTCLKNHRIVYETIANYMPDNSEESYAQFEARYPHFRKELEERYPPLCENCAPAAREKIKQAQYLAKSDYLRRMVNVKDDRPLNWFRLLIVLGATAHYISIAGQLVWDIMGVLSDPSLASFYLLGDSALNSATSCMLIPIKHRVVPPQCPTILSPYMAWALLAGWLSIWWHPLLTARKRKPHEKLVGLGTYYGIQLAVIAIRSYCWNILDNPVLTGYHPGVTPGVHAVTVIITLAGSVWSRKSLKLLVLSLFSFSDTTEGSTVSSRPHNSALLAAESFRSDPTGTRTPKRFPIDKLNISTPKISKIQTESPSIDTSTDSSDDPDAMEWTPVAKPVELGISSNRPHTPRASSTGAAQSTSKSAFTTTGPLFSNLFGPREYSPPSTPRESPTKKPKPPLKQPLFFPPKDYTSTGLEAMFDRSFKISDDVDTSSPRKQQLNAKPKQRQPTDVRKYIFFCLRQASLLLAFLTFIFPSSFRWPVNIGRIIVLAVFAIIPVSSIFESIKTARTTIVLVGSFAQLLIWLFFLASHIALPEDIQDHLHIEKIDMIFISIMFGWEFQFSSLFATAPQREYAVSNAGEESKPRPTEASSHDQKEKWTFRDDRRANPALAPAFTSALPLEPMATPRRAATIAPAPTPAPQLRPWERSYFVERGLRTENTRPAEQLKPLDLGSAEPMATPRRPAKVAPAPTPASALAPAPRFRPWERSYFVERGLRTENTRPAEQLKPLGLGSVPHFPPPTAMRGSSPLRTVQEDSSSDLYPPPFSSIPRYPQPNSSFTSLSEDILERPQSPTASVTTANDTIPDPPSPQYSRSGRSTSMTPGPPLADLSLNDSPAPSGTRYALRNRYA